MASLRPDIPVQCSQLSADTCDPSGAIPNSGNLIINSQNFWMNIWLSRGSSLEGWGWEPAITLPGALAARLASMNHLLVDVGLFAKRMIDPLRWL